MTKEDIYFDLTQNYDWFDIKLINDCKKVCNTKQCIQDKTHKNIVKIVFRNIKIFSNHFINFGHGIGSIETELKKLETINSR